MAQGIKTQIGIDGEAEYKKSISAIVQQAKTLDSEMKLLTSSFDKNTSAEEKAKAKGEVLNKQIQTQQTYIKALTDKLNEQKEKYGENAQQTQKTQEQLNKAKTALNNMTNALNESADGAEELSKSEENAGNSALKMGDMIKANVISDVIKSGFNALVTVVKDVANAFVDITKSTINWADDLKTLSTVTGISTDSLQEFEYMADLIDTDVNTIAGAMGKLVKNMAGAKDGTGSTAEAFATLGVSVVDANGELRDSNDVFTDVINALGDIENETERDATAMQIFGKSARELNPLIEAGGETIAKYAEDAHRMGYVLDNDTVNALVSADDAISILKNQFTALSRGMVAEFAPAIAEVTELIGGLFTGETSPEEIANRGVDMILSLADGILSALPSIIDAIPQVMGAVINGIVARLPEILKTGVSLIMALINGLISAIPTLVGNIPAIISAIVQAIVSAVPQMLQAGVNLVKGLWQGMQNAKDWLRNMIRGWVGDVVAFLKNLFGIHSPSTVTAGMGLNLAKGLGVGMEQGENIVSKSWGALTAPITAVSATAGRTAGGVVFNITQREGESGIELANRINRQLGRLYV